MKKLGVYKNGNYKVAIMEDGTKIRYTKDDEFRAEFPENFDCKVCNRCDMGCPQCHEKSTCDGKLGNINYKFLEHLHPFTEIALGGGNILEQPDILELLEKLKKQKVIANITLNQYHFMQHQDFIEEAVKKDLIKGIGISLMDPYQDGFVETLQKYPNAVIHVINGIFLPKDYEALKDRNLKILILGYKYFGRGEKYFDNNLAAVTSNQEWLYGKVMDMLDHFAVVSFDNKAIEQLGIQAKLDPETWSRFYAGDDGSHTMYVDLVEGVFAKNSTSETRYPIMDTIEEMFNIIKKTA